MANPIRCIHYFVQGKTALLVLLASPTFLQTDIYIYIYIYRIIFLGINKNILRGKFIYPCQNVCNGRKRHLMTRRAHNFLRTLRHLIRLQFKRTLSMYMMTTILSSLLLDHQFQTEILSNM